VYSLIQCSIGGFTAPLVYSLIQCSTGVFTTPRVNSQLFHAEAELIEDYVSQLLASTRTHLDTFLPLENSFSLSTSSSFMAAMLVGEEEGRPTNVHGLQIALQAGEIAVRAVNSLHKCALEKVRGSAVRVFGGFLGTLFGHSFWALLVRLFCHFVCHQFMPLF
jgi:hypothetical protein